MAAVMPHARAFQVAVRDHKPELSAGIDEILYRHAAVGLAVAMTGKGRPPVFESHGFADIASETHVTEDTVFRIGSLTASDGSGSVKPPRGADDEASRAQQGLLALLRSLLPEDLDPP